MERIEPYALWIGHAGDGCDFREIFAHDIKAVVQLAWEEPAIATPRELIYCRFPLLDGVGNNQETLRLAIAEAARLLRLEIATLICCGAGMSRSPAIAAAAIALNEGASLESSLLAVTTDRPSDVAPALVNDVAIALQLEKELA